MERLTNIKFSNLIRGGDFISQLVLESFVPSIDPTIFIRKHVELSGIWLRIFDENVNLTDFSDIKVLSVGKAALSMGLSVKEVLGDYFAEGLIVTKEGVPVPNKIKNSGYSVLFGSHPIPDQSSVLAAKAVINFLSKVNEHTMLIVLISGGGSALISHPRGDVTISDIQIVNKLLIESGASINEINSIRKHCDTIKGGGLAQLAYPATVVSLVLSDVIGNRLDVIASGMTAPDSTTFQESIDVLSKYDLWVNTPKKIQILLTKGSQGESHETLKVGDSVLAKVSNFIIGDVLDAMEAAKVTATKVGLNPEIELPLFVGNTDCLAKEFFGKTLALLKNETINCLIAGGESTVHVMGSGLGGRNQDLALRLVPLISGLENVGIITLATDGGDGPTDSAGAIITGLTAQRAVGLGLDINEYLRNFDSYHFFELLGDQIKIGATGTNLNDLVLIFKTK